jgi:hypothetical protein
MEQDVIFLSKSWFPVVFYYLAGVVFFIGCYRLHRCVCLYSNALYRFLFVVVINIFCLIHIITGFYDVVGYRGYGYGILSSYDIAGYVSIQFGAILFAVLNALLVRRI